MFRQIQLFRQKLDSGRLCLGPGISLSDPTVVEALCPSVDFFWIDLEHCPIGIESLSAHLIAARAGGVAALVRIPTFDVGWIKRVLDSGAEGIIIPQVRSAEEVRAVVSACRYPPLGTRGYGPRRPSNYGRNGGIEYLQSANQHLFVCVQIETMDAANEIDAIVAIPGLDSIALGPQDLSGSMGMSGQINHPKVMELMGQIARKARKAGRYVGIGMGANEEYALQTAKLGVQWIQCGGDFSYMIAFVDQLFPRVRQKAAE